MRSSRDSTRWERGSTPTRIVTRADRTSSELLRRDFGRRQTAVVSDRVRRGFGWLRVVLGVFLVAASVVGLLIAQEQGVHGGGSLRDAAPVPLTALAVGVALVLTGILALRRR